uniref:Uncharacterized protein n=1 Tax=Parascaris equorum TaxID=6256 RepID=A0A914RZ17_PAREQ
MCLLLQAAVKRDVTRQTKYVELALIGDHSFMKEHDLAEDVAIEYMLEAVNIADLVPDDCDFLMKSEFKFEFIDQARSEIGSITKVVSWSEVDSW